jgi:plastocyanin
MQGREPSAPQSMAADSGKLEVHVDNFSFLPKVTVAAGTTVTWTNGRLPHLVVSADDQFKVPGLEHERASRTGSTAGIYVYFCSIHPHDQEGDRQ